MAFIPSLPLLYLEDFEVDQRFETCSQEISADKIIDFARQFDPQPFHLDEGTARNTFFQGLVASGWYTAAVTMRLIVEAIPIANGVIGAGGEVTWPQAARPGDVLRVEGEIVGVRESKSHPERGIVTIHARTLNQKNELLQDMTSKLVVFKRP